jgi:transcriptional regulator with XRE-family HTH domain
MIKQLRIKWRVSQVQLAQIIGVDAGTISRWELGKSEPGVWQNAIFLMLSQVDDFPDVPKMIYDFGGAYTFAKLLSNYCESV